MMEQVGLIDDGDKRNDSWLRFLIILPLDALLFFILLPIIVVQSVASLAMSLLYLGVARDGSDNPSAERQNSDKAQTSRLRRNLEALLQCCGQLDSVRRSLGVFPRYGS